MPSAPPMTEDIKRQQAAWARVCGRCHHASLRYPPSCIVLPPLTTLTSTNASPRDHSVGDPIGPDVLSGAREQFQVLQRQWARGSPQKESISGPGRPSRGCRDTRVQRKGERGSTGACFAAAPREEGCRGTTLGGRRRWWRRWNPNLRRPRHCEPDSR
jgi:hypothetical protein